MKRSIRLSGCFFLFLFYINSHAYAQFLFDARVDFDVGTGPFSVESRDVNNDGVIDLASANCTSNDVSILLGNGNGTFQPAMFFRAGDGPHSVALSDFNMDGNQDVSVDWFHIFLLVVQLAQQSFLKDPLSV